jgi:hypothetical protein
MKPLLRSIFISVAVAGCTMPTASQDPKQDGVGSKADGVIVPTWWLGDSSTCMTKSPDSTFWPDWYIPGGSAEWGAESGTSYGGPGCEHAYIVDYEIPNNWWAMNWHWAWMHIAPRGDLSTQWLCENTWTNIRIYSYLHHGEGTDGELTYEDSRYGTWTASATCHLDLPTDYQTQPYERMLRVVSQSGTWIFADFNHYSYFVTHD